MWLDRLDAEGVERRLIKGREEEVVPGVTAVKTGGHFDGSLVLAWEEVLLIADTLVTVPVSFCHCLWRRVGMGWRPPGCFVGGWLCGLTHLWLVSSRRITTSIARPARRRSASCGRFLT